MQEALTNIVKHARASRADVRVREVDGHLDMRVSDNGVGLAAGHREGAGFGLLGMNERVELAGGELRFERGEHGGTVVRARLPIRV